MKLKNLKKYTRVKYISFFSAIAVLTLVFNQAIAQRATGIPYDNNPTAMNPYLLFFVVLPVMAILFYFFFWKRRM